MDEATWLSSSHFQKLYSHLKRGKGEARTPSGRRRFRLLACAVCRSLLWHLPVRDCDRLAVEAAEAFADGLIGREALGDARRAYYHSPSSEGEARRLAIAANAMIETTMDRAATAAYFVGPNALAALDPKDKAENQRRLCGLVREVFGNPFRSLPARSFPGHVVELARECYAAFPEESDRFLILADALADLGEEQAAEHCRQGGHAKGCHVVDWVLGRK